MGCHCGCLKFVQAAHVHDSGILCSFCRKKSAERLSRYNLLAICGACFLSLGPAFRDSFTHWSKLKGVYEPNPDTGKETA
jgi:hypothetical protein